MTDDSSAAVVPDISNNHKSTLTNETTDSSEATDQPPLKKSASNVPITLNIRYKTQTFAVQCDLYDTLKDLKEKLDLLTNVEPSVQKLVNKSITSVKRDDATTTLKDLNLVDGQTLLLVGATRSEVQSTSGLKSTGAKDSTDDSASASSKKEPLCKQTKHEKVLKLGSKMSLLPSEWADLCFSFLGKPENAQIGIANTHDPLPTSIDGLYMSMLNQSGKKARLTFKIESDEIWINTGKRKIKAEL